MFLTKISCYTVCLQSIRDETLTETRLFCPNVEEEGVLCQWGGRPV